MKNKLLLKTNFSFLLFFLTILFTPICTVNAQSVFEIKGKVVEKNSDPIIGATIKVEGSGNGTVSDIDGNFSLTAEKGSKIIVSYIGFDPQSVVVRSSEPLTITLEEDVKALKEVVVVGYGVQKKESLTGAISNVKADELVKTKAPSLAQVIQGKVAGLRIRQSDGEPGNFSSNINIRGFGTPLFIIDGIVRDGANEFQRLNPEDIESISFLKDGTAAIYGMNSANGAVIVTTKKGRAGKAKISLTGSLGLSSPTDVPKMANAVQYLEMRNDAEVNGGKNPYISKELLERWRQGGSGFESTDLYDEVIKKHSTQQQYNLSVQGGGDVVTYYGNIGYAAENGLLRSNDLNYEKYTFRSNTDFKVTKNLTATVNLAGRWDKKEQPYTSFFYIFKQTRVNTPDVSAYANNNPNYIQKQVIDDSPIASSNSNISGYANTYGKNFQSLFALKYDMPFLEGLSVKAQLGYDYSDSEFKQLKKEFATYSYSVEDDSYSKTLKNSPSAISISNSRSDRLDIQTQVSYNKTIDKKHNFAAAYVFERKQEHFNSSSISRDYDLYTIDDINFGNTIDQRTSGSSEERANLSHIGRFNYDFAGRYLLELGFRYDGSFRYAPDKRWAFFPMTSIGWRISEERFIKDRFEIIDNLKFRASYGKSGEDAGDPFQYLNGYNLKTGAYVFSDGKITQGVSSPTIVNPNLTWYTSKLYDLGFDLSLAKGLFSLEFDVYKRDRSGLLAYRNVSLPNTYGAKLPQENLNGDNTQGVEFTVGHKNSVQGFHYSVKGNMSIARTKYKYIERGDFVSSYDRWRNLQTDRWADFLWGYETTGRFANIDEVRHAAVQNGAKGNYPELPGDYIFNDSNGDGVIDDRDAVPLFWSSNPMIHYGFNVEASWKNFDLYALFQGSALYTVKFEEVYAEYMAFNGGNSPAYFYDRWHLADPYDPNSEWIAGEWPAIRSKPDIGSLYRSEGKHDSDIWRRDASYLRLKSVEIGYTIPESILSKSGLSYLRIYINGNNLLTFCDSFVKPFDPEKIEGDYSAGLNYPLTKSFNIGFTANF